MDKRARHSEGTGLSEMALREAFPSLPPLLSQHRSRGNLGPFLWRWVEFGFLKILSLDPRPDIESVTWAPSVD
jgi:hypothetical protein